MNEKPMRQYQMLSFTLIFILGLAGCAPKAGGNASDKPIVTTNVSNSQSGPAAPGNSTPLQSSTPAPVGAAKVPSNILFIVDSSGSMKERVENKTKMDTAKEVLNDLAGTLSPDTQAGLLAYGHRTKNDCKDTELLVPIAPLQPDLFRQKVQSLQPLGQTPISYALRQAAEALKDKPGRKSIILISDGEETCKEDPCNVAADLKKADIDLKVHVIGFGIDKASAKKQLACIAEATGGTYKDAGSAGDLKTTLQGVAQEAQNESPAGDKGKLVTTGLDSNGKPFPWCIEVFKTGTKERVYLDCKSPSADLPPGIYDVQYYNGTAITWTKKNNIEIKAGQETRIELEQAGRLIVKALDQNGKDVDLAVKATPIRSDIQGVLFSTNKSQELLPGTFDLEGYNGPLGFKRQGVEIKSGQETVVEVTINR